MSAKSAYFRARTTLRPKCDKANRVRLALSCISHYTVACRFGRPCSPVVLKCGRHECLVGEHKRFGFVSPGTLWRHSRGSNRSMHRHMPPRIEDTSVRRAEGATVQLTPVGERFANNVPFCYAQLWPQRIGPKGVIWNCGFPRNATF